LVKAIYDHEVAAQLADGHSHDTSSLNRRGQERIWGQGLAHSPVGNQIQSKQGNGGNQQSLDAAICHDQALSY
jgi:hypothetical protein